jgi:tryptophan synthase beta chain
VPALDELAAAFAAAQADPSFFAEYHEVLRTYVGRPTPLTPAPRLLAALAEHTGHAGREGLILLKREDLCHTGAHKINNCVGQGLLARRMGKRRLLSETGAGQHGVATATVAARLGLPCVVYMGAQDVARQSLNVLRMELLGARVVPVQAGTQTLKDAMNEALRDWVTHVADTYYVIGSVAGPHPYPTLVRELQKVIGVEARAQVLEGSGRLPDACVACVGGGSNAMGLFHAFRDDPVALHGVEAAGEDLALRDGRHSATLSRGKVGVLHGARSYVLQDNDGQVLGAHSIAAGLDYPGVGPEHAYLRESGRATYGAVTDRDALWALQLLGRTEGILPALESAHAIAYLRELLPRLWAQVERPLVIVGLSGRGDKDMLTVRAALAEEAHKP